MAHVDSGKVVRLADRDLPDIKTSNNPRAALATSELPYRKLMTWDGWYADVYHVDLRSGERTQVVEKLRGPTVQLSPGSRFVAYWRTPHWYLWDAEDGSTRNLTEGLKVPFADEDDDYPAPDSDYGIADWAQREGAGHRRLDLRQVRPVALSDGRLGARQPDRRRRAKCRAPLPTAGPGPRGGLRRRRRTALAPRLPRQKKNDGFWETRANKAKLKKLVEEDRRFRFKAKAEEADRILFTRQSYREFPDLWTADLKLAGRRKLSDANPQIARFAWGSAELVEWASADGIPLQGVLIKPGDYRPGRTLPGAGLLLSFLFRSACTSSTSR